MAAVRSREYRCAFNQTSTKPPSSPPPSRAPSAPRAGVRSPLRAAAGLRVARPRPRPWPRRPRRPWRWPRGAPSRASAAGRRRAQRERSVAAAAAGVALVAEEDAAPSAGREACRARVARWGRRRLVDDAVRPEREPVIDVAILLRVHDVKAVPAGADGDCGAAGGVVAISTTPSRRALGSRVPEALFCPVRDVCVVQTGVLVDDAARWRSISLRSHLHPRPTSIVRMFPRRCAATHSLRAPWAASRGLRPRIPSPRRNRSRRTSLRYTPSIQGGARRRRPHGEALP